jgi:hypothetical protein
MPISSKKQLHKRASSTIKTILTMKKPAFSLPVRIQRLSRSEKPAQARF